MRVDRTFTLGAGIATEAPEAPEMHGRSAGARTRRHPAAKRAKARAAVVVRVAGIAARFASVCLLLLAFLPSQAQLPQDVWVVLEESEEVVVVRPTTGAILMRIDLADPDNDGQPDPPKGIAFSTLSPGSGSKAFVSQGRFLRVIDVAGMSVQRTIDLDALASFPTGTRLVGIATSNPRVYRDTSNVPVTKAYLHAAATSAGGDATFVVFDQADLLPTGGPVEVVTGSLGTGTAGARVAVSATPFGRDFDRAWYTTRRQAVGGVSEIAAVSIVASNQLVGARFPAWSLAEEHVVDLAGAASSEFAGIAVGRYGELPVFPRGPDGSLENLAQPGSCDLGGADLVDVAITGPGTDSYTIVAIDRAAEELVRIEAFDCSEERIEVGAGPIAVAMFGRVGVDFVAVVNRDDDSLTIVEPGQMPLVVDLGGAIDPGCELCGVAVGFSNELACTIDDLQVDKTGTVAELSWGGNCLGGTDYYVWCRCLDEDEFDCPCACDCDNPAEGCACPQPLGFGADGPGVSQTDGAGSLQIPPGGELSKNIWKRINGTPTQMKSITHDFAGFEAGSWGYGVTLTDDPPSP